MVSRPMVKLKNVIMKKFLSVMATATILFSACHKEEGNIQPDWIDAARFFEENLSHLQRFSGNAGEGFSITAERGTKVTFPPNAFVDGDGNIVSGGVEVGIIEILTKKDILLSGVPTEADGQLLESGGEIYIEVVQNGETLELNPFNMPDSPEPVSVQLPRDPDADPSGMILFNQGPRYGQGILEDDSFTWVVFDESPQGLVGPYSYDFSIPNFGWINVDRFLGLPPNELTFVHVNLTPGSASGLQDVAVMMVFEDLNSVIGLNYDPTMDWFGAESFSFSPNIPIGEQITIVVIAQDNQGNLFFDKQENITVAADDLYTLTPQAATLADINWLNSL